MAARNWKSPMLRGRGLKTINALPSRPSEKQASAISAGQSKPAQPVRQPPDVRWRVAGFDQLSRPDLLRR